ncbi:MAG: 50S ribosomal protein L11 methyltransferase, partial [Calditrichae bacterium]|nr:50S ribosomal protein L11 methyltransferase [Calditrichia bacterium]
TSKFKNLLKDKGKLIVSGILKEEAPQIESLYERGGLTLLKLENLNEWAAMVWEKRS